MIEITCGILVAISVYLILDASTYRRIFGIALLGSSINIILLFNGQLTSILPAFIKNTPLGQLSNSLAQALILTAIVIGFGLLVFLCSLMKVLKQP